MACDKRAELEQACERLDDAASEVAIVLQKFPKEKRRDEISRLQDNPDINSALARAERYDEIDQMIKETVKEDDEPEQS